MLSFRLLIGYPTTRQVHSRSCSIMRPQHEAAIHKYAVSMLLNGTPTIRGAQSRSCKASRAGSGLSVWCQSPYLMTSSCCNMETSTKGSNLRVCVIHLIHWVSFNKASSCSITELQEEAAIWEFAVIDLAHWVLDTKASSCRVMESQR